jgi:multidrug resistance efflux pump
MFHRKRVLAGVFAVAVVVALWVSTRRTAHVLRAGGSARWVTLQRRDFVRTLRLHGVIEAVRFHGVVAPRLSGQGGPLVITRLAAAGTPVKAGDLLVTFDRQAQAKTFLDRQAEYRDRVEQIRKRQAEAAAARTQYESEVKERENALEIARLDMRRNEVASRIEAEKNKQNLAEAVARLDQARATLAQRGRALAAEVRVLEIQRDRARAAMLHAERNAGKMEIRSPIEGIVVLNPIFKDNGPGEVQEGDEVRPGVPFLQVVDPQSMRVRSRVNQVDVRFLGVGQPAVVRLDAYPDAVFPGRVEQLAAIGMAGGFSEKVRTFATIFSVKGSDARMMPDLSAAVDVELERVRDALVAPRDAVMAQGRESVVRVRNGDSVETRAVRTGAACDHEVVILSGVEAGASVLRAAAEATGS